MKEVRRNDDAIITNAGTKKISETMADYNHEEHVSPKTEKTSTAGVGVRNSIRAFGEYLSYGWIVKNIGFFCYNYQFALAGLLYQWVLVCFIKCSVFEKVFHQPVFN